MRRSQTVAPRLDVRTSQIRAELNSRLGSYAGKSGRRVVSAFIATAYAQETSEAAKGQWRKVADQLRPNIASRPLA
jgi:putative transposase